MEEQGISSSTSNIFKSYREEQEIIERIELACSEKRKELNISNQKLSNLHVVQSQEEEKLYNLRVVRKILGQIYLATLIPVMSVYCLST